MRRSQIHDRAGRVTRAMIAELAREAAKAKRENDAAAKRPKPDWFDDEKRDPYAEAWGLDRDDYNPEEDE